MTYAGSCHCGAIHFAFESEPITEARRCNCSICSRRGSVMSAAYYRAEKVQLTGDQDLGRYQFGDRCVVHCFCRICGIAVFARVSGLPADYHGAAQVNDYRFNLACVDGLDLTALAIELIDGKSY